MVDDLAAGIDNDHAAFRTNDMSDKCRDVASLGAENQHFLTNREFEMVQHCCDHVRRGDLQVSRNTSGRSCQKGSNS